MQTQWRDRQNRVLNLANRIVSLLEGHGDGGEASAALAISRNLFFLRFSDRSQVLEEAQTDASTPSECHAIGS